MGRDAIIEQIEQAHLKTDIPEFCIGDTVRVHVKIVEGGKERVQAFAGTVIARKGTGLSETFSLHRVAYGVGMERVFLVHSPRVMKIEILAEGDVRRAKLYHLRGTQGKKARVKKRVRSREAERAMKREARGEKAPVAMATKTEEPTPDAEPEVKAEEAEASTEE